MAWRPPWTVLDVAANADTTTIRRAYAKKLKTIRPDEDAAAFQALVEARDAMLERARYPQFYADESDIDADDPDVRDDAIATPQVIEADVKSAAVLAAAAPPASDPELPAPVKPVPATAPETPPYLGSVPPIAAPSPPPPATADDIVDLLASGLNTKTPLRADVIEAALADLPAGGLRWHEPEVVRVLAEAATKLGSETFPVSVHDAYEIAAVRLAEMYGWADRDRTIHETLVADDARILLVYLGRAHRRHAPGHTGRFARPLPTPATGARRFNWRSLWLWCFLIYALAQIVRCAEETRTTQPVAPPRIPGVPVFSVLSKDALAVVLAHDPDASYKLLIEYTRPQPSAGVLMQARLLSLRRAHVELGKQSLLYAAIERLHADTSVVMDRDLFGVIRNSWRLDRFGWVGPESCQRFGRWNSSEQPSATPDTLEREVLTQWARLGPEPTSTQLRALEADLLALRDLRQTRNEVATFRRLLDDLSTGIAGRAQVQTVLDRHRRCLDAT